MSDENTPSQAESPVFGELIPEDHPDRQALSNFLEKTPAEIASAFANTRRGFDSRVSLPKPDSSQEEMRKFWSKLGVPEKPDDYELPDGLPKEIAQKAWESGVTPAGLKSALEPLTQLREQARTQAEEWKSEYEKLPEDRRGRIRDALESLELGELLSNSGLQYHPKLAEALEAHAIMNSDDVTPDAGTGGTGETAQSVRDEMIQLTQSPGFLDHTNELAAPARVRYAELQKKLAENFGIRGGLFDPEFSNVKKD